MPDESGDEPKEEKPGPEREAAAPGAILSAAELGPRDSVEAVQGLMRRVITYLATAPTVEPRRATALRAVLEDYRKTFSMVRVERECRGLRGENERLQQRVDQLRDETRMLRENYVRVCNQEEAERKELFKLRKKEKERANKAKNSEPAAPPEAPVLRVEEGGAAQRKNA